MKLQAALEYLMTYLWAIIIIALILVAFYLLGVFNANTYSPTASPGSCSVTRPDGPGTTAGIRLVGTCNFAKPEFIFASHGVGDFVIFNSSSPQSMLNIVNSITITAWAAVTGPPFHDVVDKEYQYGMKLDYNNQPHPCSPSDYPGWCLEWDTAGDWNGYGFPIPNAGYGKFMFLSVSMNPTTKYWYANGQLLGTRPNPGGMGYVGSNVVIGTLSPSCYACGPSDGYGDAEWFNGAISDVQIYDAALSSNSIEALYQEGVGGAPIDLSNLVAWWPLNGNGNDYSGDQLNSYTTNGITFTGGPWWDGYQP
jgi:hypothetical protein